MSPGGHEGGADPGLHPPRHGASPPRLQPLVPPSRYKGQHGRNLFNLILSADDVGRLEPAPVPDRSAAEQLGVDVAELWMVAAHSWDIEGAQQAGCRTAFVQRPGPVMNPLADPPMVTDPCMEAVAAIPEQGG